MHNFDYCYPSDEKPVDRTMKKRTASQATNDKWLQLANKH